MCASEKGYLNIVKYLVEHGVNVDAKNNVGKTAYDDAKPNVKLYLEEVIKQRNSE